jgi:hypothetical protein
VVALVNTVENTVERRRAGMQPKLSNK